MVSNSNFYSAEIIEPTTRHGRRIRVRNRRTDETYYRPYVLQPSINTANQLEQRVREIHTSPFLDVKILWYDRPLEMLFFEVIRRE
jgi:hypothetical protein